MQDWPSEFQNLCLERDITIMENHLGPEDKLTIIIDNFEELLPIAKELGSVAREKATNLRPGDFL